MDIVVDGNIGMLLVFEIMNYDLKSFYESFKNNNLIIDETFVKGCLKQILNGILYLHNLNVIHRDIKPQNILISYQISIKNDNKKYISKYSVKIADLGLARSVQTPSIKLTPEVITLWYRPPEILLGCTKYSKAVDIWGVGCVFYELYTFRPLFPGNDQWSTIIKIFRYTYTYTYTHISFTF